MNEIITINGKGIPIRGADIDTDQIIPARFLKEITFEKMGEYLFADLRYDQHGHKNPDYPLNQAPYQDATILVVGVNFGCGSSREHAPQAIKRYGFNAIIGVSFGEIFAGNCKSLGILTVTVSPENNEQLTRLVEANPKRSLRIDLKTRTCYCEDWSCPIQISEENRQAFMSGAWNELGVLKSNMDLIRQKRATLPYLNGFK